MQKTADKTQEHADTCTVFSAGFPPESAVPFLSLLGAAGSADGFLRVRAVMMWHYAAGS